MNDGLSEDLPQRPGQQVAQGPDHKHEEQEQFQSRRRVPDSDGHTDERREKEPGDDGNGLGSPFRGLVEMGHLGSPFRLAVLAAEFLEPASRVGLSALVSATVVRCATRPGKPRRSITLEVRPTTLLAPLHSGWNPGTSPVGNLWSARVCSSASFRVLRISWAWDSVESSYPHR